MEESLSMEPGQTNMEVVGLDDDDLGFDDPMWTKETFVNGENHEAYQLMVPSLSS